MEKKHLSASKQHKKISLKIYISYDKIVVARIFKAYELTQIDVTNIYMSKCRLVNMNIVKKDNFCWIQLDY